MRKLIVAFFRKLVLYKNYLSQEYRRFIFEYYGILEYFNFNLITDFVTGYANLLF